MKKLVGIILLSFIFFIAILFVSAYVESSYTNTYNDSIEQTSSDNYWWIFL